MFVKSNHFSKRRMKLKYTVRPMNPMGVIRILPQYPPIIDPKPRHCSSFQLFRQVSMCNLFKTEPPRFGAGLNQFQK